jgi:Zn-dependent protease with chaperone function
MDLASLYLRAFFGARPFISDELDSLADRMRVSQFLSSDRADRYFMTRAKRFTAVTFGRKVVFGSKYYEQMSAEQRLAVGAHEFAHVLKGENRRSRIALSSLGVSAAFTAFVYIAFQLPLASELAFCATFIGLMTALSSKEVERSRLEELNCDSVSASYVSGDAMIGSIRLAESMLTSTPRRVLFRTVGSTYPSLRERTDALASKAVL